MKKLISVALIATTGLFTTQTLFAQGKMGMMKPMDGSMMVMSKYDFTQTLAKVKQAINENELMVIHEIDGQAMMKMAGKEIKPMHKLFYFHPKYMRKVNEANMMAGIQIPLVLIISENMEGMVMLRYFPPSTLLKQYEGTAAVAKELDGIVDKIVGTVKGKM